MSKYPAAQEVCKMAPRTHNKTKAEGVDVFDDGVDKRHPHDVFRGDLISHGFPGYHFH